MSRLFSLYSDSLRLRPLLTNVVSTALLFGIGDGLAQTFFPQPTEMTEEGPSGFDTPRLLRSMFFGGIIFAPIGDKWYRILNKISISPHRLSALGITPTPKAMNVANTLARVIFDQACFPPVSVPLYYGVMTVLEQKSFEEGKEKLRQNYWPTLVSNWAVWPAIQMFNFGFVRVEYRLIVVNLVSLGWNCYISFMNNRSLTAAPEAAVPKA